jgi:hypothetical protein
VTIAKSGIEGPLVYVRFRPAWSYIDGIREFGRFFCERTFNDPSVAERATTILQETLENAVKYSSAGPYEEVEISLESDGTNLAISVTSTPSPEHVAVLKAELARVNAQTPEEAYIAAFERAALETGARSRIGLARVRLEGNVDLSLTDLESGRITITARGSLEPNPLTDEGGIGG